MHIKCTGSLVCHPAECSVIMLHDKTAHLNIDFIMILHACLISIVICHTLQLDGFHATVHAVYLPRLRHGSGGAIGVQYSIHMDQRER